MKECVLNITSVSSLRAEDNVLDAINRINGIKKAEIDKWGQNAIITYDENLTDINAISQAIENQGYKVEF